MIDVALTPAELRPTGVAAVIDVVRASPAGTQAQGAVYRRVVCDGDARDTASGVDLDDTVRV